MVDLFDIKVGGAGWHITSHLIALVALFVACFAITGYITFRDDSIPTKALNDSGDADQDITVNDIKATGDVSVSGELKSAVHNINGILLEENILLSLLSGTTISDLGLLDLSLLLPSGVPVSYTNALLASKHLASHFTNSTTLTDAQASDLIGGGVMGTTLTDTKGNLVLSATANTVQLFAPSGVQTDAIDIRGADLTGGNGLINRLVVFTKPLVSSAAAQTFSFSFLGDDGAKATNTKVYVTKVDSDIISSQATAADGEDLTYTPTAAGSTILPGSFIYVTAVENNGTTADDQEYTYTAFFRVSGTAPDTVAFV